MAPPEDPDLPIRLAAFHALERLVAMHGDVLPYSVLQRGFEVRGERVFFMTKAQGIFKPARMRSALSLLSSAHVRAGRTRRYADSKFEDGFVYDLQDGALDSSRNRPLLDAFELGAPIIYFHSVATGQYAPVWPAYIVDVDLAARVCQVVADDRVAATRHVHRILGKAEEFRRQYATYEARRRLHQAEFRHRVLNAYDCRCGVCGLPERVLIDAAHIIPDSDEAGEPVVPNGVALCGLHHGAFDAHLLGIRPDHAIVIADRLMAMSDGPTLRHGLQGFNHQPMRLPRLPAERPGDVYLSTRWQRFEEANRERSGSLLLPL